MSETVLITGGTGFIGGWCIVELLKRGYLVRTTECAPFPRRRPWRAAVASAVDPSDRLTFFCADLTKDDGWEAAVAGCEYVLHVASPLGGDAPKDPNALIVPARDGTLRRASCRDSRWGQTSGDNLLDRRRQPTALQRGQFERRNHVDRPDRPERQRLQAIQDSGGAGRLGLHDRSCWPNHLDDHPSQRRSWPSADDGKLWFGAGDRAPLNGRLPGTPRVGFSIVDVRDVADLHIRAMTSPEAAGERFIAAGDFMWVADVAKTLRAQLGERAKKVPTSPVAGLCPSVRVVLRPAAEVGDAGTRAKAQLHIGESATRVGLDAAASDIDHR